MKHFISLFFSLFLVLNVSAQKAEQIYPCLDVNGDPIQGCIIVSDNVGSWHPVYKGTAQCVDGDILTPYLDHATNSTVVVDTIYGACDTSTDCDAVYLCVTDSLDSIIEQLFLNQRFLDSLVNNYPTINQEPVTNVAGDTIGWTTQLINPDGLVGSESSLVFPQGQVIEYYFEYTADLSEYCLVKDSLNIKRSVGCFSNTGSSLMSFEPTLTLSNAGDVNISTSEICAFAATAGLATYPIGSFIIVEGYIVRIEEAGGCTLIEQPSTSIFSLSSADCYNVSATDADLFVIDKEGALAGNPNSSSNVGSVSVGLNDCASTLYKFNVEGRIRLADILGNTAIGDNSLLSNTTGNFLTSFGNAALQSNTTGRRNTAIGDDALLSNQTGSNNTGVGANALKANTGSSNTAVGYNTLLANTTGGSNIGLGVNALRSNTTGSANMGIGTSSLFSNTTGQNNVGVGALALNANVDGGDNVGIGTSSLQSNTTGGQNVGIGYRTNFSNETGNQNTAIGTQSLESNVTGSFNTSIGYRALYVNTASNNTALATRALMNNITGVGNTATGINSMFYNTAGSNNTANGFVALFGNVSGDNNVAVGNEALYYSTTGNNNTAIGDRAGFRFVAENPQTSTNVVGNTITITGHGYTIGEKIPLQISATSDIYFFDVVDANTITSSITISGLATGAIFSQNRVRDNSTRIGSGSYANQSNRIGLGDDNINEVQVNSGDIFLKEVGKGVIVKSPDGNCWRVTVDNTGAFVSSSIPCPAQ